MRRVINQNVNYADHTSSSAPTWNNSSAAMDSVATIIRDSRIVIVDAPVQKDIQKRDRTEKK